MRIESWITKATDTNSEYVILGAFPLQQWLDERTPMLRFTYFACFFQQQRGAAAVCFGATLSGQLPHDVCV
jgi:hypothetical protein